MAKTFQSYKEDKEYIIFASGVSNSTLNDKEAFERERKLLLTTMEELPLAKLVYFSTCSIYDNSQRSSAYVHHKLLMENLILLNYPHSRIFRVSNLVGISDNPNTVLNYLYEHIKNGTTFHLWQSAWRNLIDAVDAFKICDHILKNKLFEGKIVNVANPYNYKVIDIVNALETFLGKKGNYRLAAKGDAPLIDISMIEPLFVKLGLNFEDEYLEKIIAKYYTPGHDRL